MPSSSDYVFKEKDLSIPTDFCRPVMKNVGAHYRRILRILSGTCKEKTMYHLLENIVRIPSRDVGHWLETDGPRQ